MIPSKDVELDAQRMLVSSVCTSTQLKSPTFQSWMPEFRHAPMILHRKLWEWAYIGQALSERGMLQSGKRGLGFAVGKEPLAAVFAAKGCDIVATDLGETEALAAGWATTNQHARDLAALNEAGICPNDEFAQRVSFRVVDMNAVPDDLRGFDFVWSSCAIEHLGSIDATLEFLSTAMACLKPGGVAVHTTEYNIQSDDATITHGATVFLRRRDLMEAKRRLESEGHRVAPLDFETGDAADDQVILEAPYTGQPCLKIRVAGHAITSIGFIAEAGSTSNHLRRRNVKKPARRGPANVLHDLRAWFAPSAAAAAEIDESRQGANRLGLGKGPLADLDDLRYAYRLLLGRDPDPTGFANHAARVATKSLAPTALADSFIGSAEYAARHTSATTPVEVSLDGYSVFVRPIDHDVGQSIRETKAYEPHVTAVVREVLRPGNTFIDVGANVGFFTAMAAHIVGPGGKVYAIEPMDKNVQLICASVWRNAFSHVEIFPYAASDHEALLPIATEPATSNAQIVLPRSGEPMPAIFALARRIDDMLGHVGAIDLLKIDVEGHELLALRGFSGGLARCRPRLLTEFHPRCMRDNAGIDPADYLAFLFSYGKTIDVLHVDGERVTCTAPADVMRQWEKADHRLDSGGTTHLDLFVEPRNRG